MLEITIPQWEQYEEVNLLFEHSLVTLSKWESIHEKPFFSDNKTDEETLSYVRVMCLNNKLDEDTFNRLSQEQLLSILEYINSKQSATWFNDVNQGPRSREIITSELVYYWMVAFKIPFQPAETWHFNRLMTLIKICGEKQTKPKKMSKAQQAEQYRSLNEQRRNQSGSSG